MAFATGTWTEEEHERFLQGLPKFACGPWKQFSDLIGTRAPRQVQTHAQKYFQKIRRHKRGLRKIRRKVVRTEHRIDEATSAPTTRSIGTAKAEEDESPRSTDIPVDWEIPPLDLTAGAEEPSLLLVEDVCEPFKYPSWIEQDMETIRELANDAELAQLGSDSEDEDRALEEFLQQLYGELDEQQS